MPQAKTDRRVKYTKMVLKNSLVELLEDTPIEKVTVKEICEKADINRGTFYAHYKDQAALYQEAVNELVEGALDILKNGNYTDEEGLFKTVVSIYEYIKENSELCKIFLNISGIHVNNNKVYEIIRSIYFPDMGKLSSDSDINAAATAFATMGNVAIIKNWLNGGMEKSIEEMAEFSIKLTIEGLNALK